MLGSSSAGAVEESPRRPRRRWRALLVTVLAAVALFGGGFLWFIQQVALSEPAPVQKADGIVALTGGPFRIGDALDLLASGHGRRLLITGVNPATRSVEISRLVPEHRRWFDCCVDLDYSALNTIGNAVETRRWVKVRGFNSLIVVTANYHMPRTMTELSHQLPGITLVPFPVVSERVRVDEWWSRPAIARVLLSEYLKYIAAVVRIRLDFASA